LLERLNFLMDGFMKEPIHDMLEKRPYLDLLEEAFPGITANIKRCETIGFPWKSTPFLKEEKGEILSHVGFLEYPMLIKGRLCKVAALHAVCTKVTHRGSWFSIGIDSRSSRRG
jgi:hypothetical protein